MGGDIVIYRDNFFSYLTDFGYLQRVEMGVIVIYRDDLIYGWKLGGGGGYCYVEGCFFFQLLTEGGNGGYCYVQE